MKYSNNPPEKSIKLFYYLTSEELSAKEKGANYSFVWVENEEERNCKNYEKKANVWWFLQI